MQLYNLPRAATWLSLAVICLVITACSSNDEVHPAPRRVMLKTPPAAPPVELKKVEVEEVAKKVEVAPVEDAKPDPGKPVSASAEKKKSKSNSILRRIFRKRTTATPALEREDRIGRPELSPSRRDLSA